MAEETRVHTSRNDRSIAPVPEEKQKDGSSRDRDPVVVPDAQPVSSLSLRDQAR
jgi:hypothetical protein